MILYFPRTMEPPPGPRFVLRAYRTVDLAAIRPMPDHRDELLTIDAPAWAREGRRAPGLAWTIERAGAPIASAGCHEVEAGRFTLWAWLSVLTPREWGFATRCARNVLNFLERDLAAETVTAWCRAERPAAKRYLERLGFEWTADATAAGRCYREMIRTRSSRWTR